MSNPKDAILPEVIANAINDLATTELPFSEVVGKWDISANNLCARLLRQDHRTKFVRDIRDSKKLSPDVAETVEDVLFDEERRRSIFVMDEPYIAEQYGLLAEGSARTLPNGMFLHDSNIELLIYQGLAYNNPQLASGDRPIVVTRLGEITINFQQYLKEIKLGRIMSVSKNGKSRTHLDILKSYDRQFRNRFKQPSVFDLRMNPHLHEWGETSVNGSARRKASNGYFRRGGRKCLKARKAVYHTLTEEYPALSLERIKTHPRSSEIIYVNGVETPVYKKRDEVISVFENMEEGISKAFRNLGFQGLMDAIKGQKCYSKKILDIYDRMYQKATGDASIMNPESGRYLGFDSQGRVIRSSIQ